MVLIFLSLVYLVQPAFSAVNNRSQLLFNALPDDAIGEILKFADNQIQQRIICSKWYLIINKTTDNDFGYQSDINYLKQLINDLVNPINVYNHSLLTEISVKIRQTLGNNSSIKIVLAKYLPKYMYSTFIPLLNSLSQDANIYPHRNSQITQILASFSLPNFNSSNTCKYHPYFRRFRFYNSMISCQSESWNQLNCLVLKAIDDVAKTDDLKNISMDDVAEFLFPKDAVSDVLVKAGVIKKLDQIIQKYLCDENNYYSLKERQLVQIEKICIDKYISNMTKLELYGVNIVFTFCQYSDVITSTKNLYVVICIGCCINWFEHIISDDPFGHIGTCMLTGFLFVLITFLFCICLLRRVNK